MPNPFTIPGAPQGLLDKINARYATIPAGMVMQAENTDAGNADGAQSTPDESGKDGANGKDEKLGEGGLKALKAEREARQALEAQVKQLEPLKAQMEALAAAFGVKADDGKLDVAGQVADLQKQLADMAAARQREDDLASVLAITDGSNTIGDKLSAADVSLLKSLQSREAMEAVAKRLAEGAKPGIPKADRSVGRNGSGTPGGGSVTAGRDLFRERHTKTTS